MHADHNIPGPVQFEKREERFKRWLAAPGVEFSKPESLEAYKSKVTRLIKVIKLEVPDRVPVTAYVGFYPAYHYGIDLRTAMYDYEKLIYSWTKFLLEFDLDVYNSCAAAPPGRVLELLDPKTTVWPGHGISSNISTYQYIEGEYMKPDEYDDLIDDPSDFWMRVYLPRILGTFEPFRKLSRFTNIFGLPPGYIGFLMPFSFPDVQNSFRALLDAANELGKWMEAVQSFDKQALAAGFPAFEGSAAFAPFDVIADFLRGTRGAMTDMYRQPDKLIAAMEKLTPLIIKSAISMAGISGSPITGFPLHKGDDFFMSDKQFEVFYWPTLKKVLLALIQEGLVPSLYAEGSYNRRLEMIKDLPRGTTVWRFDRTDMLRAKKVLGSTACICGNVPASLFMTGDPLSVKEYCRNLIEQCGEGGGYILSGETHIEKGNPENIRAMIDAAKKYGVYHSN
jgi:hypothetical protein